MSRILLIRHAETDLRGTFCGHSDPPLNESGLRQLSPLVDALRSYDIGSIYSSDLRRARSTAEAIAAHFATPIVTYEQLREIDFGAWEALTWREIEELDRAYAQRWLDENPHRAAPGGESYEDFRSRVLSGFAGIVDKRMEGDIAIVTHAGVMQLLLTELGGDTAQQAYERTRTYCCVVPLEPKPVVQHV